MDGRLLSNLHFANDIVCFVNSTAETEVMIIELNVAEK